MVAAVSQRLTQLKTFISKFKVAGSVLACYCCCFCSGQFCLSPSDNRGVFSLLWEGLTPDGCPIQPHDLIPHLPNPSPQTQMEAITEASNTWEWKTRREKLVAVGVSGFSKICNYSNCWNSHQLACFFFFVFDTNSFPLGINCFLHEPTRELPPTRQKRRGMRKGYMKKKNQWEEAERKKKHSKDMQIQMSGVRNINQS